MHNKKITEIARVIRSKNAGPFELTLDIIFNDSVTYETVKKGGALTPEKIARLYRIPVEDILNFCYVDAAYAGKATIPRMISSGSIGDSDVFGAQQHAPLLNLEIPWAD